MGWVRYDSYTDKFIYEEDLVSTTATCTTEPQPTTDCRQTDCYMCKWLGEVDVCGRCRNRNLFAEADTEPTISKMEQVDKDINVRSKDKPQTEREGE